MAIRLPAGQRANWLKGYINDVIAAVECGRPDLTSQQADAAVLDFARGVALRMRLHTIH